MEQGRSQRREEQRKLVDMAKFLQKLGPKQKELVDLIVNERFKSNMEKYLADYLTIFIDCTVSVLRHQGMSIDFIEEYVVLYNEFYKDEISKKRILQGECEMAVKKFEKDLKEKVIECLWKGMKRNEIVEKVVAEFPKASKTMIHKAIDEYKEEVKNSGENTYTKAIDKAIEQGADEEVMTGVAEVFQNEIEKEEEILNRKKGKGEIKVSGLKVKEIAMIVEGENGEYNASKDGVILVRKNAQIDFINLEELEKWTNEVKEVFKMVNGGVA